MGGRKGVYEIPYALLICVICMLENVFHCESMALNQIYLRLTRVGIKKLPHVM